jgi:hypothetical protein
MAEGLLPDLRILDADQTGGSMITARNGQLGAAPLVERSSGEEPVTSSMRVGQQTSILYIGPVPARKGRPNGYRNRSNEVGGSARPPPPSTPFR